MEDLLLQESADRICLYIFFFADLLEYLYCMSIVSPYFRENKSLKISHTLQFLDSPFISPFEIISYQQFF